MKTFIRLALAALAVTSCSSSEESIKQVADRVFALAETQCTSMDAYLTPDTFPKNMDKDGKLVTSDINWWCSGFYPGSLWYIYQRGGNEDVRALAEKNTLKLSTLLEQKTDHDVGFQINSSFGNAYRFTGDESWKPMIHASAKRLASRFNPVTGTLRSWDFVHAGRDWQWPVIVDNMMNLELLMNAAELFQDDTLRQIALTHANTTMANHFRDDYSSYHLVDYDIQDGHARLHHTVQGFADESAWARGQAWAVYGYTMMARESGVKEYLTLAENIAKYLLGRLPEDCVPYWDFDSDKIPDDLRDASAGAIIASAFVELAGLTSDSALAGQCLDAAETAVRTLASPEYLADSGTNAGFILKHSVGNIPGGTEIDVPLTYADYYFLEALIRLEKVRK